MSLFQQIKEESKRLVMNAAELEVLKISWEPNNGSVQEASKWNYEESDEIIEVLFDPPLKPGSGMLKLKYTGSLNDKMKGFYRSKCKNSDGVEYYNGVTQFEATDARKALVCWDEPAVKATFDVTLIVPKDKVALSNMVISNSNFSMLIPIDSGDFLMSYLIFSRRRKFPSTKLIPP